MIDTDAIQDRIRELSRQRNAADAEWAQARRHMAKLNKFHQAKLANIERSLKEAKDRHRQALAQQRGNEALQELKELAPRLNGDSERLSQSLAEANRLISKCDAADVRQDSIWSPESLPMLLQTPDGQVVLRRRGV